MKRVGSIFLALVLIASVGFSNSASAQTFNSVSHIHQVKVVGNKVLVLTHEGLYELVSKICLRVFRSFSL